MAQPRRITSKFITPRGFTAPLSRSSARSNQVLTEKLNIQAREVQLDLSAGNITEKQAAIKLLEIADIAASAGLEYKSLGYQIQAQALVNKAEKAETAAGKKIDIEARKLSEAELTKTINEIEEEITLEFNKANEGASPLDVYDAVAFLIINQIQAVAEADIDEDVKEDLTNYLTGQKGWKGIGSRGGVNTSSLGQGLKDFSDTSEGNIYDQFWNVYDTINKDRNVVDEDGDSIWVWEQIVQEGKKGLERGSQKWVVADSSEPEFRGENLYAINKINQETGKTFRNVYYYSPVPVDEDEEGNITFGFIDRSAAEPFQQISEEDLLEVTFGRSLLENLTTPFGTPPPLKFPKSKEEKEIQAKILEISSQFREPSVFLDEPVQTEKPEVRQSFPATSPEQQRQSNPLQLPGKFEAAGLQQFKNIFFPKNPIARK
tara:strand:+ start:421 stop:1716 length:1296 start_codon:yes stop_codon:yes gene_type:complete